MCHLRVWTWELDSAASEQSVGGTCESTLSAPLGCAWFSSLVEKCAEVQKDRQAVLD